MSIRLRFTLLYNAILALTLFFFGLALYGIQARTTFEAFKQDMSHTSDRLVDLVLKRNNPNAIQPPNLPPDGDRNPNDGQVFRELPEREILRVLDANGELLLSPFGRGEDLLPLSDEGLESARMGMDWWETGDFQGQEMLIYTRPVEQDGSVAYLIQVARPLTEQVRSLKFLAITFLVASLFTILVAFGIGWALSGVVLQPIHRVTQTAKTIGEERDFTRRVSYTGPQDEVGQLATTFNIMLAQLQDAYQKVAHSLEMQRNFVADVSHELRTPLTTLRGNLGLLGRQPSLPADEQADILTDMTDESDRLIRLVNDLLVLARADAGRNLSRESVALLPILEETCRQARQLDPRRELTLAADDLSVIGDRDALKQVLLIALDNALKHSSSPVAVSAHRNGGQVEIRVKDAGEGIPPEKLEHVFDRFYRGEESTTIPGFGLGLPIARALVEGMGGVISMESEVGHGSVLIVTCPLAAAS